MILLFYFKDFAFIKIGHVVGHKKYVDDLKNGGFKMTRLKGLSLFSSVGLAETYFKNYDIDIKIANELTDVRAKFHKHLYPDCKMIVGDITQEKIKQEIIDEAIQEKCDFVIATPPCQGMSLAGLRKKDDVRNRLILDAVEIIQKIKPKFIIFENVPIQLKTSIYVDDEWVMIPNYLKSTLGDMYFFLIRKMF